MAHKVLDISKMLNAIDKEGKAVGLKINWKKTKVMHLGKHSNVPLVVSSQQLEAVEQFTYLGSEIAAGGGSDEDVISRLRKAKCAFGMLSSIWRNNSLPISLKVKLFHTNVLSVLLYGCSTWRVVKSLTSKLQVFVNRCLRTIFRIFWPNRISNYELLSKAKMVPIDVTIRNQKWRWIGHTLRKDTSSICRQALDWNPPGGSGRAVGGPRKTWRRTVEKESESIGKSWQTIKPLANNRVRWRTGVVSALCPAWD